MTVLLMVFSFTFFTYNGQRLFRLRKKKLHSENLGARLQWVIKHKTILTFFCILFGIIGLGCTYFINPYCWIILVPMGILSVFYVVPVIPFYSKSPTLRDLPYLKIFFIAIVWSITIVWIPLVNTNFGTGIGINLGLALLQNFLFVVAITLPFDIRDLGFDKRSNLKTIPQLLGVKRTIVLSEILLIGSIVLLYFLCQNSTHFYALLVGHLIAMTIIATTKTDRKELFFAGLIEGIVLIIYGCTLIAHYFYSL